MNRKIKFRAYHNKAQKMLESGTTRQIFSWQDEGQDITIMQFTGLKDCNGKEIYEGDILHCKYEDSVEETGFSGVDYEVVFKDGAFGWIGEITGNFFSFATDPLDEYEVIGNIYENPELLHSDPNAQECDATEVK